MARRDRAHQPVMTAFSRQGLCFHQGTDSLLEKKWIPAAPDEKQLERIKFGIPAQQHLQQIMGIMVRQRT